MMGKCPSCNNLVARLNFHSLDAGLPSDAWKAMTYSCPSCNAILGCQIDPIAVEADIVAKVTAAVRKLLAP